MLDVELIDELDEASRNVAGVPACRPSRCGVCAWCSGGWGKNPHYQRTQNAPHQQHLDYTCFKEISAEEYLETLML